MLGLLVCGCWVWRISVWVGPRFAWDGGASDIRLLDIRVFFGPVAAAVVIDFPGFVTAAVIRRFPLPITTVVMIDFWLLGGDY